jgi:hypothetical protein
MTASGTQSDKPPGGRSTAINEKFPHCSRESVRPVCDSSPGPKCCRNGNDLGDLLFRGIRLSRSLVVNWRSTRAAGWIGVLIFASVLFVYLPILIANPSDIGVAINYVADTLAISGEVLLLAGLLPEQGFRAVWDLRQEAPKMPGPSSTS